MLYGLEIALKAAGYFNLPAPADIVRAVREGRLPWIDQREGRWGFDEADVPRIAQALGLKALEPDPNVAPPGIDGVLDKFNELFR
jgi:hypothetical protein